MHRVLLFLSITSQPYSASLEDSYILIVNSIMSLRSSSRTYSTKQSLADCSAFVTFVKIHLSSTEIDVLIKEGNVHMLTGNLNLRITASLFSPLLSWLSSAVVLFQDQCFRTFVTLSAESYFVLFINPIYILSYAFCWFLQSSLLSAEQRIAVTTCVSVLAFNVILLSK